MPLDDAAGREVDILQETTTDADGKFVFRGLEERVPYSILADGRYVSCCEVRNDEDSKQVEEPNTLREHVEENYSGTMPTNSRLTPDKETR